MLLALIKKELIALTRDMHGLAALFLMPMVFIVLMSLTLKDIYRPPLAELSYAIDMHDTATPAQWLKQLWQRGHGAPQPLAEIGVVAHIGETIEGEGCAHNQSAVQTQPPREIAHHPR